MKKVKLELWVHYDSKSGYVWPQVYPSEKAAYIDEKLNYPLKSMKLSSEPYTITERRTCSGSFGNEVLIEESP